MIPIHSFRREEIAQRTGVTRSSAGGSVVFVHDVRHGLTYDYDLCDLIYSEVSWMKGYEIFKGRAEKDSGTFKDYQRAIARIISQATCPVILVCGKQTLKSLPYHQSELRIKLNGYWEMAYGWGIDISGISAGTNEDLLYYLAKAYNTVGDFSCGYGVSGGIFKICGKKFVMSDINEKCVTYIAENILNG